MLDLSEGAGRMSLMQKLEDFVDRITTGEQMQYVLAGTLIPIIIISLLTVILNLTGSSQRSEITEMHFYCLETGKEFVVKPEDLYKNEDMMDPGMMGPMGMRMISPYTNERTAVPMTLCPNCKKYFVPEYYLQENYENEYYMPEFQGNLVCPHCHTDIIQWYRDHRKKRK
jgi:hypothetical protein